MEAKRPPEQPIVIAGGFLAAAALYEGLRRSLTELSGQPTTIVPILGPEWLMAVARLGWIYLLWRLDRTVRQAAEGSPTGRVTLVGHSAGGVLGRLYLGERPFFGRTYAGRRYVNLLITLGSPHHNRGGLTAGGKMARYVERLYPGATYADVRYIAVAGRSIAGDPEGSPQARRAAHYYRRICGQARAWGDGLVPVETALLHRAEHLVLDGVAHYSLDGPWYGSPEVVPRWWEAAMAPAMAEPVEAELTEPVEGSLRQAQRPPTTAEPVAHSPRQAQRPAAMAPAMAEPVEAELTEPVEGSLRQAQRPEAEGKETSR